MHTWSMYRQGRHPSPSGARAPVAGGVSVINGAQLPAGEGQDLAWQLSRTVWQAGSGRRTNVAEQSPWRFGGGLAGWLSTERAARRQVPQDRKNFRADATAPRAVRVDATSAHAEMHGRLPSAAPCNERMMVMDSHAPSTVADRPPPICIAFKAQAGLKLRPRFIGGQRRRCDGPAAAAQDIHPSIQKQAGCSARRATAGAGKGRKEPRDSHE